MHPRELIVSSSSFFSFSSVVVVVVVVVGLEANSFLVQGLKEQML